MITTPANTFWSCENADYKCVFFSETIMGTSVVSHVLVGKEVG